MSNSITKRLVRVWLRGFQKIVRNSAKIIQDYQLANYAIGKLGEENSVWTRDFFAIPSIENTSVLRNYVHHLLTKEHKNLDKAIYGPGKASMLRVLKGLEAGEFWVECGGLSQILFGIYQGLGYCAVLSDWVDQSPSSYTDSHMLVEVYIPELNKYIIQDPSFNIIVTFRSEPISSLDLMMLLRIPIIIENKEIVFVNNQNGEQGVFTLVRDLNYENYFDKYFGQPASWFSRSNILYPAVIRRRIRD